MPTVPYTPRAVISSLEVDDDLNGAVQHSPPPASLTTSAPQRQGLRNGLDSSRCSASISTAEVAEQDHEQAEDANEPLSSPCGNHGPSGPAELPRQTQPHESGSQNDSASIDADNNIADDGDRHSSRDADSDSSSDSNSGSDGDDVDHDYDDDGSPSDTDGEDGSHSKKRKTGRSPSVTGSDDGHADGFPSDDNTEEIFHPWSHKRQKLAHDREDTTPVRRQNSMPCSAGRLSQSPRRPQTASMLSPPASHSLSESESDKGSDCSKASAASFGEWLLQNAALKCVTIDGVTTYQLQFQRAQAHSCSRQRETRPHRLVRSNKRGRKPRDETKGRRCGVCNRPGHNARTCQKGVRTSSEDSSCES
ncbi:hypothetical protein HC256_001376 [Beauveria bassiana]|nr:hypothetical protein HC256_001376 [Beauveria bassiana]